MAGETAASTHASASIDRWRTARAAAAVGGSLWALVTFPLVGVGWSWPWVDELGRAEPYRSLAQAIGADAYIVVGALGSLSFLAIGSALLPDLRRAGWGGTLFAWTVIAGAAVTAASYLGTPEDSPLHAVWGAEPVALLAIALAGVAAALTAGRRWPLWTRILLAATIAVLVGGAAALGYYPHGCLVALGIEAAALILGAPRDPAPQAAVAG